ncbi:MAG: hypothetical protein H7X79_09805 [Sporomusaceae bacterium]|nr:hypothetical protein [Sporomusaceae bacterium]
MRLPVKKQATWLILAMILTPNIALDYKKDVAFPNSKIQESTNWSESIGPGKVGSIQEFNNPMYKTVRDIMIFFEKRNLDVASQNGRFILFYKVK